jgi:hypothetical protein
MLLDEMEKVCRWNRKYILRVLNKDLGSKAGQGRTPRRKSGRPPEYNAKEILEFLIAVWHATNQACSKRLQAVLYLWLPWYEATTGIALSLEHQVLVLRISHSTIDRLLRFERQRYRVGTGRATTKPGTLLKRRIPVKTEQWNEDRPGFLEGDTVAHCGTTTAGAYVSTLNTVDIASTWVEARAIWRKGEIKTQEAVAEIEEALPFDLLGFDVDNGTEMLNYCLATYLLDRKHPVEYTRSREYRKNDNAHIEGRNWTHIRQFFGYERFDNPAVVPLMNDLYANEFSLLVNFFLPSVKLQQKERRGSKIIKRHDKAMTPCDRLLASPHIPERTKRMLRARRRTLNPFELYRVVREKIKRILQVGPLRPSNMALDVTEQSAHAVPKKKAHRQPESRSASRQQTALKTKKPSTINQQK